MTREERARKMAQQVAEPAAGIERFRPVLTVQEAIEVALAFADAEAAAMRERAADVCNQISSHAKKQGLPQISAGANSCSEFIRSLPVGEGQ